MTRNYIKAIGKQPDSFELRLAGFNESPQGKQLEEYWFFDDHDPVSISAAQQKAHAYKDRNPGCRIIFSVWHAIPSVKYFEVGAPRAEPKWRAA